ncbi:hypothetical protein [Methylobacterium sp. CM6257]
MRHVSAGAGIREPQEPPALQVLDDLLADLAETAKQGCALGLAGHRPGLERRGRLPFVVALIQTGAEDVAARIRRSGRHRQGGSRGGGVGARGGLSDRTTDPSARLTHSLAEAPSR